MAHRRDHSLSPIGVVAVAAEYPRAVPRDQQRAPTDDATRLQRRLLALAALAAWSVLPPYLGPPLGLELDVSSTVEVVDHVIPGLCAIAAALIARYDVLHGQSESIRALAALGVCVLAGLFQTVSHFTLVLGAGEPQQPVDSVVLHATPGPVLLGLSLWLLLRPTPQDATA